MYVLVYDLLIMSKTLPRVPEPPLSDDQPNPVAAQVLPPQPTNIRTAIGDVFDQLGGVQGFANWVNESTANKRIFYKEILPKVVPREVQAEVSGPGGGPVKLVVEWAGGPVDHSPAAATVLNVIDAVTDNDE